MNPNLASPALNNSILLREAQYNINSGLLDEFNLLKMFGNVGPTDLGVLEIWAMTRKQSPLLFSPADLKLSNVVYTDDPEGRFKYTIPVNVDYPRIVEDIEPLNTKKGIAGTTFKLKFNKLLFSNSDIITYDLYTGVEVHITQDDIIDDGTGNYIYTCRVLSGGDQDYLDNKFVQPGTPWFVKSSAIGEHNTRFSNAKVQAGFREYVTYCGNHKIGKELYVTKKAALLSGTYTLSNGGSISSRKPQIDKNGRVNVYELFKLNNPDLDPSIIYSWNAKELARAIKRKEIDFAVVSQMEAALLDSMLKDIELYLMWGKGGYISDSNNSIRTNVGFWDQANNAYKIVYNKDQFSLALIIEMLTNFTYGRIDYNDANPNRTFILRCGTAFAHMFNKALNQELGNVNNFIFRSSDKLSPVQGKDPMHLSFGYFFNEYIIPFIGRVIVQVSTAFDPWDANNITNPIIDGRRLSSYSAILFDVTDLDLSQQILLLKNSKLDGISTYYINGNMDYLGRTGTFQSSGEFSGFKLKMETYAPSIFIKDPTRLVKLVMRNPITGGSF